MPEPIFDHDRLDVYRLSIKYVAISFKAAKSLIGLHRHARDQWLRAAQSIPLNIAEGNGKRSLKDRSRFLDIARGSALECAAIQDVLAATDGIDSTRNGELKKMLKRIVSMLTRLIARADVVSEPVVEFEYEYRGAGTSTILGDNGRVAVPHVSIITVLVLRAQPVTPTRTRHEYEYEYRKAEYEYERVEHDTRTPTRS